MQPNPTPHTIGCPKRSASVREPSQLICTPPFTSTSRAGAGGVGRADRRNCGEAVGAGCGAGCGRGRVHAPGRCAARPVGGYVHTCSHPVRGAGAGSGLFGLWGYSSMRRPVRVAEW
eukprot:355882-Chlamydomonas_euryale.AAC.2